MIEEIKQKLDNDINYNLSIEELKILYGIDYNIDESLEEHRKKRNNYLDFCKMFGLLHVARSP